MKDGEEKMAREFNKNMFIMLMAIMIGVVIITFFIADIVNRSKIDTLTAEHNVEITSIKGKSENFTSNFLKSSVILDQAREYRAFGNYHFDLGFLWFKSAISAKNKSNMELYKIRGIDNCTNAMPEYYYAYLNFGEARNYYNYTKLFTIYSKYLDILDIYVKLTTSGAKLTMLRYNASLYLKYLIENLTFDINNNNVTYFGNVTGLLFLFDETMGAYEEELGIYEELQEEIDEYEFFDEIR